MKLFALRLLTILLLLPALSHGQRSVRFKETFDDNSNDWTLREGNVESAEIKEGHYAIKLNNAEGQILFWKQEVDFDPAEDFLIETDLVLVSGGSAKGFSFIWGAENAGNFLAFGLNSEGEYRIYGYKDYQFSDIIPFTAASSFKPAAQGNRIEVKKSGEKLHFSLNGALLGTASYTPTAGKGIGFITSGSLDLKVNEIIIRQEKPMAVLLKESFNQVAAGWSRGDGQSPEIANGTLLLKGTHATRPTFVFREVKLGLEDAFEIKASMRRKDGALNEGFGLTWGTKDDDNYFIYLINSYGAYMVASRENGVYKVLKAWAPSEQILNLEGDFARLTVKRGGDELSFFLNDVWLWSMPWRPVLGDKLGFAVKDTLSIEVDELLIQQGKEIREVVPPALTWLTPEKESEIIDNSIFTVKAGINSSSEISTVTLFVNNELISLQTAAKGNIKFSEGFEGFLEETVSLREGKNQIRLIVKAKDGGLNIQTRDVEVKPASEIARKNGTDYALFFATDAYDQWANLINPVNDAQTIGKELTDNYGYQTEVVVNASKKQILTKLKEYAKKTYTSSDQLMIFFAGHGKFDDIFGEGYVVCTNSLKEDEGNDSYISHSSLRTIVNNIDCKHTFLAMDVCFGGTIDPFIASGGSHRGGDPVSSEITENDFIERKMRFKTRKYLTSGGKEYVPDGTPGQHSPFARKFLEALRNYGGHDKIITLAELLLYFERLLPEPRYGEFGFNEPGSDFLFIAR